MSYACVSVVYGFPLEGETLSDQLDELFEEERNGFLAPYSGHSDPRAFGVELSGFEEGDLMKEGLKMTPSEEQKAEFETMFQNLDPAIQQELNAIYPQPFVFFLWSTS